MEEKSISEELSYPILLAERIRKAVEEAESYKQDCLDVGERADRLAQMLRSAARTAASNPSNLYEKPIRRIVTEAVKNLEKAQALVRKCKRRGILKKVVTMISATDFRKVFSLLDNSLGDMKWLLDICSGSAGIVLSLPPIASIDPILSWVWSYISVIQSGNSLDDRVEASHALASLASASDRNKKIIMEEGGVGPLLKLLKEGGSSDAQIAAATALVNLASDQERVLQITNEMAIPVIVQTLHDSPMRVQIRIATLISRMAAHDRLVHEEFGSENAIRPLVSLLAFEMLDDSKASLTKDTNMLSVLQSNTQINKEMVSVPSNSNMIRSEGGSSRGLSSREMHRKEREQESPEVKLELKIKCAEALWILATNSASNSRRITETKGLLCLAKIIEKEQGELQLNCLMAVMEIATAAESNSDLRRAAFKTNSPAAKAVVDQLLRVIQRGNPTLQIPAIKSIGSLARTFPARETRVISLLVNQLSHRNSDVAAEAAIALGRFATPDNFLCVEHSKAIIEFEGVPPLMRLLRSSERAQLHGLILLCYIALHVGSSEALEQARALTALQLSDRSAVAQHSLLRDLLPKAIYQLELYHAGIHPHKQAYAP